MCPADVGVPGSILITVELQGIPSIIELLYQVMVNESKIYHHRLNKGFGSKFCEGFRVRNKHLKKSEERIGQLCEYNNKDEDNSLNTLNDKN